MAIMIKADRQIRFSLLMLLTPSSFLPSIFVRYVHYWGDNMRISLQLWQLSKPRYQGKAGLVMNRRFQALLAASVLLLGGCDSTKEEAQAPVQSRSVSLEGLRIGGPFTLTDQDGAKRNWDDFRGKYRLVYFGYTYCPDVCPVDLQRIMQGYAAFAKKAPERAARIQPIFISLDPDRDTPAVVKTYVSAFSPRLIGLTGTPEQVAAVAKDFAVAFSKENSKGAADYLVAHTRTPYLFDPAGKPLALVPVDDPTTAAQEGLPEEVRTFLDQWIK